MSKYVELEDYLFQCRAKGLSERTLKGYRNNNIAFLNWVKKNYDIDNVEEFGKVHLQTYINEKLNQGRKEQYLNVIIKAVGIFFTFLETEEYIHKNPMRRIKLVREPQDIIQVYTDSEAMGLIKAFDQSDYLSVRNKTMIALQLDTGIRCSETIDIRIQDVLDDRIIIHGKGKKIRTVPISYEMHKILKRYFKAKSKHITPNYEQGDNLFLSRTGRKLTVEGIESVYRRAGEMAQINSNIRISPHTSRHYYAVNMLKRNDIYTVSKLLGHASVKITERYLRSVTSDEVIDLGRITSPLTTMKNS